MNAKIYRIVPVSRGRSSGELLTAIHQAIQSIPAVQPTVTRFVYISGGVKCL